jgi:DinB superfamily
LGRVDLDAVYVEHPIQDQTPQDLAAPIRITMDYQNLTLQQIYAEAEAVAGDAKTFFGHLNSEQLNWKPAADSWSVAQCLDHLISANREYYPVFDRILKGEYRKTFLHRMPFLPALFGRVMINVVSPDSQRKFKAPGAMRPSSSSIDSQIVDRFIAHQRETLARIKSLEGRGPSGIIITSPVAGAVIYSLLDAFRLVVAHERRHFAQARRVMETHGFPPASPS